MSLTPDEKDELSECAQAYSLGCDDWYTRRRYLELIKKHRASCTCAVSMDCVVHGTVERAMRGLDARDCDAINAAIPDPGDFNYSRGR